ncbi:MAG: protein kinase domain-containing protein [Candidatus Rariloculaceae bacterium]
MNGNTTTHPSLGLAVLAGVLAIGALSLPPLDAVQRADRVLYDWWTRTAAPQAPDEIIVVNIDNPAWFTDLARIARQQGARLSMSSLAAPTANYSGALELGPVAVAPAGAQLLRETDWERGGYLWLQPDFDGVIRHERPLVGSGAAVPSLALAGSIALQRADPSAPQQSDIVALSAPLSVDTQGRRWIRFFDPASFHSATRAQILSDPSLLAGKIVIVGQENTRRYATPVGALTVQELLAQQFAGYWLDSTITTMTAENSAVVWTLSGLLLVLVVALPLSLAWNAILPVLGSIVLLAGGAGAFFSESLWYPIAGPVLLALVGGACSIWARRGRSGVATDLAEEPSPATDFVMAARGTVAAKPAAVATTAEQQPAAAPEPGDPEKVDDSAALKRRSTDPRNDIDDSPSPETVPDDSILTLGRYELLKKIGRGATGLVYLGRDPKINRKVAIKTIDLAEEFEVDEIDEIRERFLAEAETAGRLSHPNIVTIFDTGEENNVAYIAMELLRGRHLSDHTLPSRLLPVPTTLELLARAAKALEYAHRHKVVHRDIKPANIMYDSGTDALKLTDFGIARLMDVSRTRTGIVLGTPSFMSPEQLEGEKVDGHTDFFALGVTLYQLLTGHLPFRGESITELMFVIANEPHPAATSVRSDLPEGIDAVMDKALAKKPADRFSSGTELAHALRQLAAQAA